MNSLSNTNTFNHYSRPCTFGSTLHSNTNNNDSNIEVFTSINDNGLKNVSCQNETVALNNLWTKGFGNKNKVKPDLSLNFSSGKITWNSQNNNNPDIKSEEEDRDVDVAANDANMAISPTLDNESTSPSHHARRPMNAFLIFCKKHRPIVRKKFPNLENRGVTRILGEWWALLDDSDKNPYKDLAKEYKDAFFCANPDFKWYKLPAPPLRTLATRPSSVQKEPIHQLQSPTLTNPPHESEFTPGKLADESQLGSLSALLNVNSYSKSNDTSKANSEEIKDVNIQEGNSSSVNNNIDSATKVEPCLESPPTITKEAPLPPKPIKKRKFVEDFLDISNKTSVRNIFNVEKLDISETYQPELKQAKLETKQELDESQESITNKELIEKVIDNTYQNQNIVPQNCSSYSNSDTSKEPRKSGRSCKGKLYAEFMVHGKLIKNKREKRYNSLEALRKDEDEVNSNKPEIKPDITPNFDLQNTIKRLAERTKVNLSKMEEKCESKQEVERIRTNSESSEDSFIKYKFDLQKRIDELPSLDYDSYTQRKREIKKRKFNKTKLLHMSNYQKQKLQNSISTKVNISNNNNNVPTGSKKRKNKLSITHLEKRDSHFVCNNGGNIESGDLSGLTTLAEVASNKEKINQEKVLT
ncbi:putative high mobility group protein [Trypoxylus dichotomus]